MCITYMYNASKTLVTVGVPLNSQFLSIEVFSCEKISGTKEFMRTAWNCTIVLLVFIFFVPVKRYVYVYAFLATHDPHITSLHKVLRGQSYRDTKKKH